MPDVSLPWGGDFSLTTSGDLLLVDNLDLTDQRVIRRLLTAPNSYLWEPGYGAGVPAYIGTAVPPSQVIQAVKAQILQESSVARSPAPTIDATLAPDVIGLDIDYYAAASGAPQTLSFDVLP